MTRPSILVLAGTNGAGKSSVIGSILSNQNTYWYDPDVFARHRERSGETIEAANSQAWTHGREQLELAIAEGSNYSFETTLGGNTITRLLEEAALTHTINIIYCGLASVEMHLARVRQRVSLGGHDIPEAKIRERWPASRRNLIRLMPKLYRLQVLDNSTEAPIGAPTPYARMILHTLEQRIIYPDPSDLAALQLTPEWAKPLVEAALDAADTAVASKT